MSDLFAQIRSNITTLEEETSRKQTILADVLGSIQTAGKEAAEIMEQRREQRAKFEKEAKELEEAIKPLRSDLQRLEADISTLVGEKGELQKANFTLDQNNKEFKAYETKAWQALKTKDTELQKREQALKEREQLRPVSQSFLPPTSE